MYEIELSLIIVSSAQFFRHMVETHHETKLKLYDNWLCTAKKCVDFYCTGLFRKYGQNWSIREGGGTLAISITQACGASIMLSVDEEEIESTGKKYDKVFWKFLDWGVKSGEPSSQAIITKTL